jgi:hypothetical protein
LKSKKQSEKIKGKFLTKLPKCIFKGQAPFSLSRKFPKVQKRAKRKTKRGIQVFDCPFLHQTQNKLTVISLNTPKTSYKRFLDDMA